MPPPFLGKQYLASGHFPDLPQHSSASLETQAFALVLCQIPTELLPLKVCQVSSGVFYLPLPSSPSCLSHVCSAHYSSV